MLQMSRDRPLALEGECRGADEMLALGRAWQVQWGWGLGGSSRSVRLHRATSNYGVRATERGKVGRGVDRAGVMAQARRGA